MSMTIAGLNSIVREVDKAQAPGGELRCADTDWEQYTAHLSLQGWRPVRDAEIDGIYNDGYDIGFGQYVRTARSDPLGQRLGTVAHLLEPGRPIEWAAIDRSVLLAIEERLERT